jgi:hypothetical protein
MTKGTSHLGYALSASPNTAAPVKNKATKAPPFIDATWFIPADRSSSHAVGFITDDSEETVRKAARTDRFVLGEGYFRVVEPDGLVYSSVYCAFPTATAGVWSLSWNETAKDGIPVDLRTVPFPAGAKPPNREGRKCQTTNY